MEIAACPRIVIVGAGLAGLACADELERSGLPSTLLESDERVGGRVQTDEVDGFRLDRGFQVLLTSYPETRRLVSDERLQLRRFFPGAVIARNGRLMTLADPWRRPFTGLTSVVTGAVSIADGLRMARLRSRVRRRPTSASGGRPERTALDRLRYEGFSDRLIESFFRPFFGGVFLDRELATTERQLEFVFDMFSRGDIAVPAHGMGEITALLAAGLERSRIHTGVRVTEVGPRSLVLDNGERMAADAVVVATDADTAHGLVESIQPISWRGVTCLYFAADEAPLNGPRLWLDGDGTGPVNNLVVMSEVAPETSPDSRSLISVTVLGTPGPGSLETDVRRQLSGWFGPAVARWRHLRSYSIERALPDQRPPMPSRSSSRLEQEIYVCGDHRRDGSINGAMASGRDAARAVIEDLAEAEL